MICNKTIELIISLYNSFQINYEILLSSGILVGECCNN